MYCIVLYLRFLFDLKPTHSPPAYEYQLVASGGSGTFYWQSRNTTVVSVNGQGVVRSTGHRQGATSIIVSDVRHIDIDAFALVYVLTPQDLQLQACPVETTVRSRLYVNIQMNAILDQNGKSHDQNAKEFFLSYFSTFQFAS